MQVDKPLCVLKSVHVSDVILDDKTLIPHRLYNIQLQIDTEQIQDLSTLQPPTDKSWPSDQELKICAEIAYTINTALCRTCNPSIQLTNCEKFAISITPCATLDATAFGGATVFGWYEMPIA
jgi:hypothetical protein